MTDPMLLCMLLFSVLPHQAGTELGDSEDECALTVEAAALQGVPAALVASLGWHESKFNPAAVSTAGAIGSLQALPRFWCDDYKDCLATGETRCRHLVAKCDRRAAGINAIAHFLDRQVRIEDPVSIDREADINNFPDRAIVSAVCRFTGCRVNRPGRPVESRMHYVDSIITRAQRLQKSLDCRCSLLN